MTLRQIALNLIALGVPWTPLIAAPHWSNFPASPGAVTLSGKVQATDFFAQTFLIRLDDGNVETVPFSRWTGFFRVSKESKGGASREEMDPSEVGTGDRLHILLDPSQSTAERIEVLPSDSREATQWRLCFGKASEHFHIQMGSIGPIPSAKHFLATKSGK
jgi:hypothetical protein